MSKESPKTPPKIDIPPHLLRPYDYDPDTFDLKGVPPTVHPMYKYNGSQWVPAKPSTYKSNAPLNIMSYNIWFDYFASKRRTAALIKEIEQKAPDVIGLQEVTSYTLKLFLKDPYIRKHYTISDPQGNYVDPYGVIFLSRVPVQRLFAMRLPTRMGREVIGLELNDTTMLATVHLESLNSAARRHHQLLLIEKHLLSRYPHAVLMGDFNFGSWHNWMLPDDAPVRKENQTLLEAPFKDAFVDTWAEMHLPIKGSEPTELVANSIARGYTYDCARNPMLRHCFSAEPKRWEQNRLDRIIAKGFKTNSCDVIGTEPFDTVDGRPVVLSDHYGLLAHLSFS